MEYGLADGLVEVVVLDLLFGLVPEARAGTGAHRPADDRARRSGDGPADDAPSEGGEEEAEAE